MTIIREWHLVTGDGTRLHGQTWEPPRWAGELFIVHGLGEHLGRYHDVASFFAERGLRIVIYSQRGHGRSSGVRGHAPSFGRLLDDLHEVVRDHGDHGDRGVPARFLYGHSMGGCIVLNEGLRSAGRWSGIVASSPLLLPAHEIPAWKEWLARVASLLFPWLRFDPGIDPSELTSDDAMAAMLREDPDWHPVITARLAVQLFAAGRWALDHAPDMATPTLLMHGSDDELTSPLASRRFAEQNEAYCRFVLFQGMRHELHHERQRQLVWKTVGDWLAERSGRRTEPSTAGAR